MKINREIRYLTHSEIDPQKWDECLAAGNPVFAYAFSQYLDKITNANWNALVFGDYEAVFPLPFKRKWGIAYVVQPVFCQQLGAFGSSKRISNADFLQAIPWFFPRVRLQLNSRFGYVPQDIMGETTDANFSKNFPGKWDLKPNFLLPLDQPLVYSKDARRNLAALNSAAVQVWENRLQPKEVISLFRQTWGQFNRQISDEQYQQFLDAVSCGIQGPGTKSSSFETQVYSVHQQDETLLGAAIILKTFPNGVGPGFLHYVCGAPTAEGRKQSAMHAIIDFAIKQHEGQKMIFDFEGSSIPSVAAFYKKFNPIVENYGLYSRGL